MHIFNTMKLTSNYCHTKNLFQSINNHNKNTNKYCKDILCPTYIFNTMKLMDKYWFPS